MLNKFNLLFEEIKNDLITNSRKEFTFSTSNGNTICTLNLNTNTNDLIVGTITINKNGKTVWNIEKQIDGNTTEKLTEKDLMVQYYDEYKRIENELTDYKNYKTDEVNNNKLTNVKNSKIVPFKNKLEKNNNRFGSWEINGITYTADYIEDKVESLYKISFSIINDDPKGSELDQYKVNALVRLDETNSIILKFLLYNTEDELVEELSKTKFEQQYPNIYIDLQTIISKLEFSQD